MERKKNPVFRKADAILTGDWHLREDKPTCRTDDFQEEQWDTIKFISELQRFHDCPVLHSGDLFHGWKPSPWLLSMSSRFIPKRFYTVYGQHDLPQHNFELRGKSGIYNLNENKKVQTIPPDNMEFLSWKQEPEKKKGVEILVWHKMNYQGKAPWPGCPDPLAASLLRKYKQYKLILTGDNHKPFIEKHEGRLLVNPGNITRQSAAQYDYKPAVWLWYEDSNTVVPVYLPIKEGVISREHIEEKEERDNRIDAFISQLDGDWKTSVSFEDNLQSFEKANNVEKSIMEIIYKSLEPITK